MGHLGNPGHPEVQAAIDSAIARIVDSGRTPGTLVNDVNVEAYIEKGVKFLMTSFNPWIVRGSSDFLGRVSAAG